MHAHTIIYSKLSETERSEETPSYLIIASWEEKQSDREGLLVQVAVR